MNATATTGRLMAAFINPPFMKRFSRESRSPSVTKSNTLYFPHWLCYAAAACSTVPGVEIDVVDAAPSDMSLDDVVKRAVEKKARLVVLDTSTPSIYSDLACADRLKRALGPDAIVAVAGPHVTATVEQTFAYCKEHNLQLDLILDGEYDFTVRELARRLVNGQSWRDLKGLAFQGAAGIVRTGKAEAIHNLDDIPSVIPLYEKFLNIPDYFMAHTKYPMVTIITGRGCPYRCSFCQLPQVMHGHAYRTRSVANVVEEMAYIHDKLPQVRGVMIEDDTFTADQERVQAICKGMLERGLTRLELTCNARADVKPETLDLMRKVGFKMLCVGFESGDQETLNKMRKGLKLTRMEEFVNSANQNGILVHGCFIFGNKYETRQTMERTLEFALTLDIDSAQFYPIMVSPGTEDYEYYKANGMLSTEDFSRWNDAEGQHCSTVVRKDLSNAEIEAFCDHARRRFYLRPRYVLRKGLESFKDWDHFKKNLRGFSVLIRHLLRRPGHA